MEGLEGKSNEEVAEFFNGVTDPLGNHALHICATYGSCKSSIIPFFPVPRLVSRAMR